MKKENAKVEKDPKRIKKEQQKHARVKISSLPRIFSAIQCYIIIYITTC